ncbi:MAG: thiamine diphosphokinase [Clostridiales bacterium]|nr:MAG: thiamine diphosphokinase [Clostridiales bacterium]
MITALIVNGTATDGNFLRKELADVGFIIAVDGGMHQLDAIAVTPNVLVGDLDSYHYCGDHLAASVEIVKLNPEKDLSDLEFAIQLAVQRGATELRLFNAVGDRLDHSLINFNVLMQAKQLGVLAEWRAPKQRLIVAQQHQVLTNISGQTFSIIPLTNLSGVTIRGAKYPLTNQVIEHYSSRCLSNIAVDDSVSITIEQGDAFIVINTVES